MFTIFTTPKPFDGQIAVIQKNAIRSWKKSFPSGEIILMGDEQGTAEMARESGVSQIPELKRNEFGVPFINNIFEKAQERAKNSVLVYVNADIILLSDFLQAVSRMNNMEKFLMVGRRWDLDVKEEINFFDGDWEKKVRESVARNGRLHGQSGIDYFVFPKGLFGEIPSFVLGRTTYDNWLLYRAWISKIPIIDATSVVTAVHQNHSYSHHPQGRIGVSKGKEAKRNLKLAGGPGHLLTLRDASSVLTFSGFKKPEITLYRIVSFPFRYFDKTPLMLKMFLLPGWLAMIVFRKLKNI